MTVLTTKKMLKEFLNTYPEMIDCYEIVDPEVGELSYDYDPVDLDDYEYQQSLYQ